MSRVSKRRFFLAQYVSFILETLIASAVLAVRRELVSLDPFLEPEPRESREQQPNLGFSTLLLVKSIIKAQMESAE